MPESNSHIPVPDCSPLGFIDLEVHSIGIQGIVEYEILHDGQGGRENPPRQMLVIGIPHKDFDLPDVRGTGNVSNVNYESLLCFSRPLVDSVVAGREGYVPIYVVLHGVLGLTVATIEAGPEDGLVGALVLTVAADGVHEDVGRSTGETPKVGKVACCVIGYCRRTIICTGDGYVGGSNEAMTRQSRRVSYDLSVERVGDA